MTLIRDPATFDTVELLLETGLPVWLSFRRCRHGVCGVYGQHWGPPEGDLFGRAARRFEELGVAALLINCLPFDHVPGMVSWLRDFTELPLGSTRTSGTWPAALALRRRIGPEAYARARARLARRGRADRRRLLRRRPATTSRPLAPALAGTKPGRRRAADRGAAALARLAAARTMPSPGSTRTAPTSSRSRSRS